jgi:hypothetical protein
MVDTPTELSAGNMTIQSDPIGMNIMTIRIGDCNNR